MRIAYIKNGNALHQVQKIIENLDRPITSGTEAFIYDFVVNNRANELLVLSRSTMSGSIAGDKIVSKVYDGGVGGGRGLLKRFSATLKIFYELMKFKPERILCGCIGELLWVSFIASKILRCPMVHARHNLVWDKDIGFAKNIFYGVDNRIIKKCRGVVCHGPFLQSQLTSLVPDGSRVYEFDIGFSDLSAKLERSNASESVIPGKYVLFVGRIEENKGVYDLLLACVPLLEKHKDLSLVIVGEGSFMPRLREKVKGLGCNAQIKILGSRSHDNVLKIMKSAWLIVCPTRSEFPEGRCMVGMEGLVMGVPLVLPDFGPFKYLIKHEKSGLFYKPDSVAEMSGCIERVYADTSLYQTLRDGAQEEGKAIIKPVRTFNQAVELAFKLPQDGR